MENVIFGSRTKPVSGFGFLAVHTFRRKKKKCVHIISISIHPLIQHVTLCIYAGARDADAVQLTVRKNQGAHQPN